MNKASKTQRREWKYAARKQLHGSLLPTLLVVALSLIPTGVVTVYLQLQQPELQWGMTVEQCAAYLKIEGATLLVQALVGAPLLLGAKRYYYALAHGETANWSMVVQDICSGASYFRALRLWVAVWVHTLGWMIALNAGILVVNYAIRMTPIWTVLLWLPLFLVLGALVLTKTMRFEGAYLRILHDPNESVWKACSDCVHLFQDRNWELCCFLLSFLWWWIAAVCTFGLVGLYTRAYREVAFVLLFDTLNGRENKDTHEVRI